jgi:hypothetical protein
MGSVDRGEILERQVTCTGNGASILFVINPTAPPNTRVKPFADLEEAAEFLTWKRPSRFW